jgi:hypothetical protein
VHIDDGLMPCPSSAFACVPNDDNDDDEASACAERIDDVVEVSVRG